MGPLSRGVVRGGKGAAPAVLGSQPWIPGGLGSPSARTTTRRRSLFEGRASLVTAGMETGSTGRNACADGFGSTVLRFFYAACERRKASRGARSLAAGIPKALYGARRPQALARRVYAVRDDKKGRSKRGGFERTRSSRANNGVCLHETCRAFSAFFSPRAPHLRGSRQQSGAGRRWRAAKPRAG